MLFEDALFFGAEFVGALVFFAVLLLKLFEVFAEFLLLFHELLHGALVFPIDLRILCELPAEFFHFFSELSCAFPRLPHLFLDVCVGLVAFFTDVHF